MLIRRAIAVVLFVTTMSCDEARPTNVVYENMSPPEPEPPKPRYDSREGDLYLYVADVSEEDKKRGVGAGSVHMFRYLGRQGDLYRLSLLNSEEIQIGVAECANPCRVVRSKWRDGSVSRLGYSADTVIGSAFEDAFNGILKVSASRDPQAKPSQKGVQQRATQPPDSGTQLIRDYDETEPATNSGNTIIN